MKEIQNIYGYGEDKNKVIGKEIECECGCGSVLRVFKDSPNITEVVIHTCFVKEEDKWKHTVQISNENLNTLFDYVANSTAKYVSLFNEKTTDLESKAFEIAREAHKGQKRKGGEDFIIHPGAVASCCKTEDEKVVAWLHDVLEDTPLTASDLIEKGIPANLVDIVKILTRRKNQTYFDYIMGVMDNPIAVTVKIWDLRHNIATLSEGSLRDKYMLALHLLHIQQKGRN